MVKRYEWWSEGQRQFAAGAAARGANENTVTCILFFIEHIFGSKSPTPLMPTVAMKGMAKAMERHIMLMAAQGLLHSYIT